MRSLPNALTLFSTATILLASACAPMPPSTAPVPVRAGLPAVPVVDGPLDIRVVHPTPSTTRPSVDSTFIFGSVGTGRASLTINGADVPVAPNGAFLAFLPVPADGTYRLAAEGQGRSATATRSYQPPPVPGGGSAAPPLTTTEFPEPRSARITGGSDTVATGSDIAVGRPTPTGTYRWFLPRGARIRVTGQRGDMVRVRLDTATAWFPASVVTLGDAAPPETPGVATTRIATGDDWVDVRFTAAHSPFLIELERHRLRVTLYDRAAPTSHEGADPLVEGISWSSSAGGSAQADVSLTSALWGYQTFYEPNGDLVLRIRRPPPIDATQPFRGLRILIDPGHPPAGAIGPTGLTEAEANLAIALPLASKLRARGADVVMSRTTASPMASARSQAVELAARTSFAVASGAHLMVSVHNNAFGEGVNPFRNHGTSTYYFHPFSADLARSLNQAIVQTTLIRDLGARIGNLALVRPSWLPTALTESLFMMLPEQESALRDPAFLDRLAEAHVAGLETFLLGRR